MQLVAEMILEHISAECQWRPQLAAHLLAGDVVRRMPEVMPFTEPNRPPVLLRTLANSAPPLRDMLDRGQDVHMPH